MYTALDVAYYIVTFCLNAGSPISNLQLQKILYFVQGEFLGQTGQLLFADDLYAWKYGPVVPEVYYEFNIYAGMPILRKFSIELNDLYRPIIDSAIQQKMQIPAWKLVNETHEVGTPWDDVYANGVGEGRIIPKEKMFEYFCKVV